MRLDKALTDRGLARSRSHAQQLVAEGSVLVDGRAASRSSQQVGETSVLRVADGRRQGEVSRAQRKLGRARSLWPRVFVPAGTAVDLGASTGGFTQELLDAGWEDVWAIDVGHDQLVDALRSDPRVVVREGVNARDLSQMTDAGLRRCMARLVVCDVSFISLRLVLPTIAWLLQDGGTAVVLVKPQFEVGLARVRQGIVERGTDRHEAMAVVLDAAAQAGLRPHGVASSGTPGTHGNVEFVVRLETGDAAREVVGAAWHSGLPDVEDPFWNGDDDSALEL
ncbi:16S/23S rRNA (cytidine-2'-O)-methyltransferase [Kytococcus schroeteri]|uniref:16S/23S rRNA (Cytidine-2'-O)-methyltransferase n=1 Tax=Kytococcus schroeteri TaxID=138300 RepID=A0A2I1P9U8_9MICO|nr:TlyA family RNA methyltransferase [Kytococcus schroeteri]PKZ41403.1 16S/23S rRNA (cytidine-2'-O)-methyltransferase [Kytococcus schroeteri]